ncbi:MAG: hypothetical protein OCD76_12935 [Reichenbachiella sp.]
MKKKKIQLGDIPKKEVFEAPDGFFDSFNDELDQIIDQKEQPQAKVVRMNSASKWMAVAATVFLVMTAAWIINTNNGAWSDMRVEEDLLASVSSEDIALYLMNSAVDTDMLLEEVDPQLLLLDEENLLDVDDLSVEEMNILLEEYEDIY